MSRAGGDELELKSRADALASTAGERQQPGTTQCSASTGRGASAWEEPTACGKSQNDLGREPTAKGAVSATPRRGAEERRAGLRRAGLRARRAMDAQATKVSCVALADFTAEPVPERKLPAMREVL
mmetsp:Transcript_87238/g.157125  ORF Transcript_87238/g.157125 Transcript_87238/m.157125 type:complete len:126 (+) Transcript_87238:337-714(+)